MKTKEQLLKEEAKKDSDSDIRREAYRVLGFTEEAKNDSDDDIRREAYRVLGFTEEAKKDSNSDIRREAELYFKIKEAKEKLKEFLFRFFNLKI